MGNLEWAYLPGTLRETNDGVLWKWSVSVCGSSVRGTLRGVFFTGDPEGYVEEGSGYGHLFPKDPSWATWKGAHLPGTCRDG